MFVVTGDLSVPNFLRGVKNDSGTSVLSCVCVCVCARVGSGTF